MSSHHNIRHYSKWAKCSLATSDLHEPSVHKYAAVLEERFDASFSVLIIRIKQ